MRTAAAAVPGSASWRPSVASGSGSAPPGAAGGDVFHDARANLEGFIRTRASVDPEDVVFSWQGDIYSEVEGEGSRRLFEFEGFSVARAVRDGEGWQLLTREAALYRDPKTHQVLGRWLNPWTNIENHVVPVLNDPVNQVLAPRPDGRPGFPVRDAGDTVVWDLDIFMRYASPLPRRDYPLYSGSDTYEGAELFQFFTRRQDLDDPTRASVPATLSWTRMGPWLPWMEMGDRPGRLVYHATGHKLEHGVEDLSPDLRQFVEQQAPQFLAAPTEFTRPNETTWTYFRKLLDSGQWPPASTGPAAR